MFLDRPDAGRVHLPARPGSKVGRRRPARFQTGGREDLRVLFRTFSVRPIRLARATRRRKESQRKGEAPVSLVYRRRPLAF